MNTQCVVIGQSPRTGSLATELNEKHVPTRAFELNGANRDSLLGVLRGEKDLRAVAVFTREHKEAGVGLINGMRELLPGVAIHVFHEEDGKRKDAAFTSALKRAGVKTLTFKFPIKTPEVLSVLKNSHFPHLLVHADAGETYVRTSRADDGPSISDDTDEENFGLVDINSPRLYEEGESAGGNGGRKPNRAERRADKFPGMPTSKKVKRKAIQQVPQLKVSPKSPPKAPRVSGIPADMEKWKPILERVKRAMSEGVLVKVPPLQIYPMKDQPRKYFDEMSLRELANSIKEVGQMMPGIIRKISRKGEAAHYQLLDGERRWRAITFGKIEFYRAVLVEIDDEAAPFVIASIANFHRKDHTPLEISDAIERLHNQLGMPVEEVARMYNISSIWAYLLHGLQNLHPSIRDMLGEHLSKRKRLPITAAIEVSKLEKPVQGKLVSQYRAGIVTLRGLRKAAISLAQSTGTHIRTRSDGPKRALRSLSNITNRVRLDARDVVDMLGDKQVASALLAVLGEAARIDALLKEASTSVAKSCELIKKYVKKK